MKIIFSKLQLIKFSKLTLFFTLLITASNAQLTKVDYYNSIDNKIFLLSKKQQMPYDSVVCAIGRLFSKEEDKVRAFYTWIALNISYDSERLKNYKEKAMGWNYMQKDSSQVAEVVFRNKKAVCEGFSLLLNKFCKSSNIRSQMVIGYTKTPDGEVVFDILHAWNAVKIDSTWQLLDITWSNGYVGLYGIYHKYFSDKYFMSKSPDFLKDHLPMDPMWQLTTNPVTKSYFFKTDTTKKYFSNSVFNYNDSINLYLKQDENDQLYLNYIHYSNYDHENLTYIRNADILIYNKAAELINDAILDFQEFAIFYSKVFLKEKNAVNCKKAKSLLDSSKQNYTRLLAYLSNKKAFAPETENNLKKIGLAATSDLTKVKQALEMISKIQKTILTPKK